MVYCTGKHFGKLCMGNFTGRLVKFNFAQRAHHLMTLHRAYTLRNFNKHEKQFFLILLNAQGLIPTLLLRNSHGNGRQNSPQDPSPKHTFPGKNIGGLCLCSSYPHLLLLTQNTCMCHSCPSLSNCLQTSVCFFQSTNVHCQIMHLLAMRKVVCMGSS